MNILWAPSVSAHPPDGGGLFNSGNPFRIRLAIRIFGPHSSASATTFSISSTASLSSCSMR